MNSLKNRVNRLEGRSRAGGIRYMWIEPEWTQSEVEAHEAAFRQENDIPASVEVGTIGWLPAQENEGEQK